MDLLVQQVRQTGTIVVKTTGVVASSMRSKENIAVEAQSVLDQLLTSTWHRSQELNISSTSLHDFTQRSRYESLRGPIGLRTEVSWHSDKPKVFSLENHPFWWSSFSPRCYVTNQIAEVQNTHTYQAKVSKTKDCLVRPLVWQHQSLVFFFLEI